MEEVKVTDLNRNGSLGVNSTTSMEEGEEEEEEDEEGGEKTDVNFAMEIVGEMINAIRYYIFSLIAKRCLLRFLLSIYNSLLMHTTLFCYLTRPISFSHLPAKRRVIIKVTCPLNIM